MAMLPLIVGALEDKSEDTVVEADTAEEGETVDVVDAEVVSEDAEATETKA